MRSVKRNGQGLVEFALTVPILLLLMFGVIEMGWIAFNFAQLYNGVREGTRYGSVPGFSGTAQYMDCAGIRNKIIGYAGFSGIIAGNISISYDDGRPYDATSSPHSQVGTCPTGGSYTATPTGSSNNYIPQGSTTAVARNPQNGDRIVLSISGFNLHWLTPFFQAVWPSGFAISNTSARSIFPSDIAA